MLVLPRLDSVCLIRPNFKSFTTASANQSGNAPDFKLSN